MKISEHSEEGAIGGSNREKRLDIACNLCNNVPSDVRERFIMLDKAPSFTSYCLFQSDRRVAKIVFLRWNARHPQNEGESSFICSI